MKDATGAFDDDVNVELAGLSVYLYTLRFPICARPSFSITVGAASAIVRPASERELSLMRRIEELLLSYPFAEVGCGGGRVSGEGLEDRRSHVAKLMKKIGMRAIYRR